ncbi:hypothetical protein NC652_009947 [Populus alba x Populus x berolinensis]|nr:hypothetical protein NC652_009947 [Populus alba x Populus x berolinensis]
MISPMQVIQSQNDGSYTGVLTQQLKTQFSSQMQKTLIIPGMKEQDTCPIFACSIWWGARICMGNEYARPQILVFLQNIMKRLKWDFDDS